MNFSWGILFSQILNQKTPFPIRKHFLIKRKASSIYLPGKKSLVLKGGIGITIMLGKVLRFGLFLWVVAIIMAAVFPLILWIGFSFWQNIFPGLIVKKPVSNQDFTGLLLLSLHFRKSIMLWWKKKNMKKMHSLFSVGGYLRWLNYKRLALISLLKYFSCYRMVLQSQKWWVYRHKSNLDLLKLNF